MLEARSRSVHDRNGFSQHSTERSLQLGYFAVWRQMEIDQSVDLRRRHASDSPSEWTAIALCDGALENQPRQTYCERFAWLTADAVSFFVK